MVTGLVIAPLSVCYLAAGMTDEGIQYLKSLHTRFPASSSLNTSLAILLKQKGRLEKARRYLTDIVQKKFGSKEEQAYARQLLAKWDKEVS